MRCYLLNRVNYCNYEIQHNVDIAITAAITTIPVKVPIAIKIYSSAFDLRVWMSRARLSPQTILT